MGELPGDRVDSGSLRGYSGGLTVACLPGLYLLRARRYSVYDLSYY